MATKKAENWWDSLTLNNYGDFTKLMNDKKFTVEQAKNSYGKMPALWRAYYDKYIVDQRAAEKAASSKATSDAKKAAISSESQKAQSITRWNEAQNQLAVLRRNLRAAQDSQTIFSRATPEQQKNLKNYQSLIDDLNKQIADLMKITK